MTTPPRSRFSWLPAVCRIALAGVFVVAGASKIMDPDDFARAIYRYHLLPDVAINPLAIYLPWLECVAAVALVFVSRWRDAAALMMGMMLTCFAVAIGAAMWRGLDVPCGCFGSLSRSPVGWWHLAVDAALLVVLVPAATPSRGAAMDGVAAHGAIPR
jgi:uncharacterized membrane protein YphA (DoxX/SURF4 family)